VSDEPIPIEEFIAARLRMKREIAALIISALAESGMNYAELEVRIGKPKGFARRYLNSLIEGKTKDMDTMSDLAWGMGFRIQFGLQQCPPALPKDQPS
jgi:hypothetical protein